MDKKFVHYFSAAGTNTSNNVMMVKSTTSSYDVNFDALQLDSSEQNANPACPPLENLIPNDSLAQTSHVNTDNYYQNIASNSSPMHASPMHALTPRTLETLFGSIPSPFPQFDSSPGIYAVRQQQFIFSPMNNASNDSNKQYL